MIEAPADVRAALTEAFDDLMQGLADAPDER